MTKKGKYTILKQFIKSEPGLLRQMKNVDMKPYNKLTLKRLNEILDSMDKSIITKK